MPSGPCVRLNAPPRDDEALKRYGLPKPIVERALMEVYQTVVLDQERRIHSGASSIGNPIHATSIKSRETKA